MENKSFWLKFTFATLLTFTVIAWVGVAGISFWADYKYSKADILLSESQNTSNTEQKILLLTLSNFLSSTDQTHLLLARAYHEKGTGSQAEKYYLKVERVEALKQKKDEPIIETYNYFFQQGYPQVAKKIILNLKNELSSRDEFLVLAEAQISDKKYNEAHDSLLRAREKDPFYPQTYQQLLAICEKVDINTCDSYRQYLELISWNK